MEDWWINWWLNYIWFAPLIIVTVVGITVFFVNRRLRNIKRIARQILDGRRPLPSIDGYDRLCSDLAAKVKHDPEAEYLWHKLLEKRETIIRS